MRLWKRRSAPPQVDPAPRKPDRTDEIVERLARVESLLEQVSYGQRILPALARRQFLDGVDLSPTAELRSHRFGLLSQNEEDGLILELFKRIGVTDRRFAEIGCGVNGGNSGFLLSECGWSGLMVDGRNACVKKVALRYGRFDVTAVRQRVTREGINSLFEEQGLTGSIDLLSLDVDGVDFFLWEALHVAQPRVVVIEYNYLFGPERSISVPYDPEFSLPDAALRSYRGASLEAMVRLGRRKGYRLVATERINAFFLRDDVTCDLPTGEVAELFQPPANALNNDAIGRISQADLPLVVVDERGCPGEPVPAESVR
jgi:hypothetical protein